MATAGRAALPRVSEGDGRPLVEAVLAGLRAAGAEPARYSWVRGLVSRTVGGVAQAVTLDAVPARDWSSQGPVAGKLAFCVELSGRSLGVRFVRTGRGEYDWEPADTEAALSRVAAAFRGMGVAVDYVLDGGHDTDGGDTVGFWVVADAAGLV
jgi:hypothetical protein